MKALLASIGPVVDGLRRKRDQLRLGIAKFHMQRLRTDAPADIFLREFSKVYGLERRL